jgi:hypothetical protein
LEADQHPSQLSNFKSHPELPNEKWRACLALLSYLTANSSDSNIVIEQKFEIS